MSINKIKHLILIKLVRARMWGGKHTPLNFAVKGLPEQFRRTRSGEKVVQKAIKELRNLQWIILRQKRTGRDYDIHISLNPRKAAEIQKFIEKINGSEEILWWLPRLISFN